MYAEQLPTHPPFGRTDMQLTPIEALYRHARTDPNGVAFSIGDGRWNYQWLAVQAERLARGLAERGIREGDRVILHMARCPELVVAFYGCFHVGAIAMPLIGHFNAVELKRLVQQLRPSLYIVDASCCYESDAIDCSILSREQRFVTSEATEGDDIQQWASLLSTASEAPPVVADLEAPAVLVTNLETSGSPRFAMHSHKTLAALFGLPFMCG